MPNGSSGKMGKNLINKFSTPSVLSRMFSYVPQERTIKLLKINKNLFTTLKLNIKDYFLDEKYRVIIDQSKGNINYIFDNAFIPFQKDMVSPLAFVEFTSKIIKYLKFLYFKREVKSFKLEINGNTYNNWFYFNFTTEILKNLKKGLCLKISPNLNYKYYDIIKEAIHNLDELKSIDIHSFKSSRSEKVTTDYFDLFDWTKIKCINFADCLNTHYVFIGKLDYIPKNASFTKLYVDEERFINFRKIFSFIANYAENIDHIKIYSISDFNYYSEGREYSLDSDYFKPFTKLRNLKLLTCKHLLLFSFLIIFQKVLPILEKLIVDGVKESESEKSIFSNQNTSDMNKFMLNINNLQKLEINFCPTYKPNDVFRILSILINSNPKLKILKITVPLTKKMDQENEENEDNEEGEKQAKPKPKPKEITNNFINFDSSNTEVVIQQQEKEKETKMEEEDKADEFINLVKAISSLKDLNSLQLITPMNVDMTNLFNLYFNIGENLNNLEIIHCNNLDLKKLFKNHPNLDKINFKLTSEENIQIDIETEIENAKKKEEQKEEEQKDEQKGDQKGDQKGEQKINFKFNLKWHKKWYQRMEQRYKQKEEERLAAERAAKEEEVEEIKVEEFNYEFPIRKWKKIILSCYPLNDSLMKALIKSKIYLKELEFNKSVNYSKKSDEEINEIIADVKKNN